MRHKVNRYILKNKMRVLLIPITGIDIVSVGIFVKVGSRYETDKNNGISHFLEHLMFKGTKNYSSEKLFNELDNVGAIYNAETGFEYTNFYITGHSDYIELYLDILIDIFINATYKDKDIETERGVIDEEINMYKNDIEDIMNDGINRIMFNNSSLKYPILGTKKTLDRLTRKDIVQFRKNFYVPERSVLIVAGSFGKYDKDQLFKFIGPKLNEMPMGNTEHIMPISDTEIQIEPRIIKIKYKTSTPYTCICYKSQSVFSSYLEEYDLIANILTSGSSSRLYNILREKLGISYLTNAENISYQYEGIFCIYTYADSKSTNRVIDYILQEINSLVEKGISEEELNKAKQIRVASLSLSLQTPFDIMSYHGMNEIDYRIGSVNIDKLIRTKMSSKIEYIMSIDLNTINGVIRNLFNREKLNIIIVGDTKGKLSFNIPQI
jgi:zinc protease